MPQKSRPKSQPGGGYASIPALIQLSLDATRLASASDRQVDHTGLLRAASERAVALCRVLERGRPSGKPARRGVIEACRPALVAALSLPLSPTCSALGCCDLAWTRQTQLQMVRAVLRSFARLDPQAIDAAPYEVLVRLVQPVGGRFAVEVAECISRDPALCGRQEAHLLTIAGGPIWQAAEIAVRALGRIGAKASQSARNAQRDALTHPRWQVRLAAARGLRALGGAEDQLANVARCDPMPLVRYHAAKLKSSATAAGFEPVSPG